MNDNFRHELIVLLTKVVNGDLDPKEVLDNWSNSKIDKEPVIEKAWHELCHFYADKDIRHKDAKYAKYQEGKLREIIDALKAEE